MELVLQDDGTKICGHCCVSMITGKPINDIIKLFGHTRGTSTKQVVNVLNSLGHKCKAPLQRIKADDVLPDLAILKIHWKYLNGTHWVVYNKGYIYCSVYGKFGFHRLSKIGEYGARATSYIEIIK